MWQRTMMKNSMSPRSGGCRPQEPRRFTARHGASPRHLALILVLASMIVNPLAAQTSLAGTVRDAAGNPLAGAKVTVSPLLDAALRIRVETGEDGRYQMENFNPSRAYRFRIERDGYRPLRRDVEVGSAAVTLGSVMTQDFTLLEIGATGKEERSTLVVMSRNSAGIGPYRKGVRAFEQGDLEKARDRLENARDVDPELTPVYEILAQVYYALGDHPAALETADQVLENNPWDPLMLRIRYDTLRALGRTEEARASLEKLAEAAADRSTAGLFHNDGVAAAREGRREEARVLLEVALRLAPELTLARDALAKVYFELGRYESTVATARQLLADDPSRIELWRLVHQSWKALGRGEETLAALDDLVRHDPGPRTATLLYNEGVEAFNAEDDATALAIFERGLALDPDHLDLRLGRASVLLRRRDYPACLELTDAILDDHPGNAEALRIAERARVRMGS